MGIASRWHDLEVQFLALHAQYGDALQADWNSATSSTHGKQWNLSESTEPNELDQFRSLAEQAAIMLGHRPGPEAVSAWLDVLQIYSPNFMASTPAENGGDRSPSTVQTGRISRLHEASANLCTKLQAETPPFRKSPLGMKSMSRWGPHLARWIREQQNLSSFEQFVREESQQRFVRELRARAEQPPAPQSEPGKVDAFATKEQRESAIIAYKIDRTCTRADLAKAANVDYSDLNKWKLHRSLTKKHFSKKAQRIEQVLRTNRQPPQNNDREEV